MNDTHDTIASHKRTRQQRMVTVPVDTAPPPLSRLVERAVPAKDANEKSLAGRYRVIHGEIALPLPPSDWTRADGTEIPGRPKQINARPGDIVELNHEDAKRMLAKNDPENAIVEPLDANPSRVGKVRGTGRAKDAGFPGHYQRAADSAA